VEKDQIIKGVNSRRGKREKISEKSLRKHNKIKKPKKNTEHEKLH
jgi:hypothetical protein